MALQLKNVVCPYCGAKRAAWIPTGLSEEGIKIISVCNACFACRKEATHGEDRPDKDD